ncbi:General secretion pathway protein C [Myxococcus hansupus]|uniref:General secretion pathway protein C n=1 Tax=Pseudomyxococcus hansupus TaxID=1297742 RepID=A0A0H4X1R9_9BACT|nr:type II secretion system protein GspC [Myxococcus hansupus]AKQ67803.1 General secretion pathway protein C [Myxococcus hansupus]
MATFLRKSFALITTGFIALAALLVAATASLFFELSLAPTVASGHEVPMTRKSADTSSRPDLEGARLAKLTGLSFGQREGLDAPSAPRPATMNTSLRLKLLGTLVAHDSQWSLASVEDPDSKRIRSLMTGDELLGARVVAIERERILFSVDGREEYLRAGNASAAPPMPTLANTAPHTSGIRAVRENTYEVPRGTIDHALGNLDGVLSQARVVPAFRDGKPQGFKLFSVKKGSLYEQLGIQTGDVLQRINGLTLDTPEKALEAFSVLRGAPHIELDIERGGQPLRKVYDVK